MAALLVGAAPADASRVKLVPFKAAFTATQVVAVDPSRCPGLLVLIDGRGHGTHVGSFTTAQSHCIDPGGADPLAFTDGSFTFTTADGERLIGTYSGRLLPTSTPGVFSLDGTASFEGGTGRFAGASGTATATGVLNLNTGEAMVFLDGVISRRR
jgi:hypothetical protein